MGYIHSPKSIKDEVPESNKRGIKNMLEQISSDLVMTPAELTEGDPITKGGNLGNVSWQSPIWNQGNYGSCTAFSRKSLIEAMLFKTKGVQLDLSAFYIYYATRVGVLDWPADEDTGALMRSSMEAVVRFGVPPSEKWPYTNENFSKEPQWKANGYADDYAPIRYFRLDAGINTTPQQIVERMKLYLAKGLVMDFGFTCYESIDYDHVDMTGEIPYPSENENVVGGHAVLAVGYDDDKEITHPMSQKTTKGAFLFKNSWSQRWATANTIQAGYGWMPYEYFLQGQADDVWTIISQRIVDDGKFN